MNAITFSQAVDGYLLAANARRLSPHTIRDYVTTFRKFSMFLKSDLPIDEITVNMVESFLSTQRVSKKTLLNYHIGLSALWTWAVTFDVGHSGPGDGDRTFAISQADDQQLMTDAHCRPVYNQLDLLDILSLGCQPLFGNWCVPLAKPDSRIIQQPFESLSDSGQLGFAGNPTSNSTQGTERLL